jgi:site-specific DNA recombinase
VSAEPVGAQSRLAVYLRVSSEEQKAKGTIETQRAVLTRYVDAQGITPTGWYEDEAVSGYFVPFAKRAAGARLLADVRAGRIAVVLVRKLDRFGRNAREMLNAVHELEQAGARLISLKENVDTSTAAGRFFLTVLAAVAELERDVILERSSEGMARRLDEGGYLGGRPPIGYRVEGKKQSARLVIHDTVDAASGYSESDVVRLCWSLLVEHDWPCDRIAAYLTDDLGIPTREGGARWAPNVVYRILADPIYTGIRHYHAPDGTVHQQTVPALLTDEQWQQAVAKLREHKRYSRKSPNHDYLLRGLMRCGLCGAPYTTSWSRLNGGKGDLWRYYACSTRHYRRQYYRRYGTYPTDCHGASVDAVLAEAQVWGDVEAFIRNPGTALARLAAREQGHAATAEASRDQLADVQRQLEVQQDERDSILALYRKARISERDLGRQLDAIAREEAGLVKKRDQYLAALAGATAGQDRLQSARTLLQRLHARMDAADTITPDLQREWVALLVVAMRVQTLPNGTSTRGRPKYRAELAVTYCFDDPDALPPLPDQQVGGVLPSAWRWL